MKKPEKSKLENLNKAVIVLKSGGVVIFPTDTVYGIGCKWDNNDAISRIRNIKSSTQNFPVLISNITQANKIGEITTQAVSLIKKHWPGGLTILVKSKKDNQKIGIRMPASEDVKYIVDKIGSPVIGTSANFHGQKAPKSSKEIDPKLLNLADFVVQGECIGGKESTVVDATVLPIKILRQGAVVIL